MISFTPIALKDFVGKYNPPSPESKEIQNFKSHINTLLQDAPKDHKEKSQEQEIESFLKNTFSYHTRSRDNIDLAILVDDKVNVLIEVKAQNNQKEFNKSQDFPLAKALAEAIFYFLKERNKGNNSIRHIIVCTYCKYYVYDAQEFVQFEKDREIKKLFQDYKDRTATDLKTEAFYNALQDHLKSPHFTGKLPYTYFSLHPDLGTQELSLIYQLLSPQVLLKEVKTLDANTLNKGFYEELLYILGLQEVSENGKSGGKILIIPSKRENTLSSEIKRYYKLNDEEIFTLLTTWNNRILFLRLLESMLLSFQHISKPFLHLSIIKNFKSLQTLFFEVLAKRDEDRSSSLPKELYSIPYLNSSLFDPIALEREGKHIGGLDSMPVALFSHSILRKDKRFKDRESLPLLEYLFEFLHAYDFTTTAKDIAEGVKQNHDKLINSAVLGLVFEKLNGYKEGSFYTPSFITSYMCKESIAQAVIEKFNQAYKWEATSLEEISSYSIRCKLPIQELLSILLSLRICDPAVGSGHFLVSALNEIVKIAYELGLISSFKNNTTLELENDEILIKTHNELFTYTRPSSPQEPNHKIQEELFTLKKSIIENCLFGVDINPNSCEITKLRLWIELLKYSYYIFNEEGENTNALETLPNIDINIKCGNSLISNFPLDSNLTIGQTKSFSKNLKTQIQNYKDSVMLYKEGMGEKAKILQDIASVKSLIISYLLEQNKANTELKESLKTFIRDYGDESFDINTDFGMQMLKIAREQGYKFTPTLTSLEPAPLDKNAHKLLEKIQKSYEVLENLKTSNAFEWRFEFPEVLDEEGNFLGFDVVIGNPPYIRQEQIKELKPALAKNYEIYKGTSDIYTYFFERGYYLLTPNGILSFITSNKWARAGYGEALRKFVLEKTAFKSYIDFNGEKIFESATVDTSITSFLKLAPSREHQVRYLSCTDSSKLQDLNFDSIPQSSLSTQTLTFSSSSVMALKAKIESIGTPLKDWDISIYRGVLTGYNEAFIIDTAKREEILNNCQSQEEREATEKLIVKMLRGRDIKRYSYEWAGLWIIGTFPSLKLNIDEYPSLKTYLESFRPRIDQSGEKGCRKKTSNQWFETQDNIAYYREFAREKIVYREISTQMDASYDTNQSVINNKLYLITGEHLKYLLGILNSSLFEKMMLSKANNLGGKGVDFLSPIKIPRPEINQPIADKIIALVEEILKVKEQDPSSSTQELESQIDSLVYTLYGLSEEEIKIIENKE